MVYLGCDVSHFEFPIHPHDAERRTIQEKLKAAGVGKRYVVLVPGTRGEHKKWPVAFWGLLAKKLADRKIYTVVSGTASEKELGKAIRSLSSSPYTVDFTGKTNLLELAALDEMADLHISCDTGPLHIANAMQIPLIALFGPTLPDRSGPLEIPMQRLLWQIIPGRKRQI